MTELEQTFDFSPEDLRKNKSGFISESQNKKIYRLEVIKTVLGFVLSAIFILLSLVCFYWYYQSVYVDPFSAYIPRTKHGETIPSFFFLSVGVAGFGMSLFLIFSSIFISKKIKTIFIDDSVKILDAYLETIEYGFRENNYAYLTVNQISLKNINSYKKGIFQPKIFYRFYYSEYSKSLLSIEILSEEYLQKFNN